MHLSCFAMELDGRYIKCSDVKYPLESFKAYRATFDDNLDSAEKDFEKSTP